MKLFACDLDNTLLIPSRGALKGDICCEVLDGRDQSFFSPLVYEKLRVINEKDDPVFLPVTTRSAVQYSRIEFPVMPRYALICNGAVLLRDGKPDSGWSDYYTGIIKKQLPVMEGLLKRYARTPCFTSARLVDGIFFFAACTDAAAAREQYRRIKEETGLDIMLSGRKLYLFPEGIDKGSAVTHFKELYGFDTVTAAGDSMIDIPMLNAADTAIVPDKELAERLSRDTSKSIMLCPENERFSEYISYFFDE